MSTTTKTKRLACNKALYLERTKKSQNIKTHEKNIMEKLPISPMRIPFIKP